MRIHDLRHTFASLAAGKGFSLPVIGGLLGHSSSQTTERYAHFANSFLLEVNQEMGLELDRLLNASSNSAISDAVATAEEIAVVGP